MNFSKYWSEEHKLLTILRRPSNNVDASVRRKTHSNICRDLAVTLTLTSRPSNIISSSVAWTTSATEVWWNYCYWVRLTRRTDELTDGQPENITRPPIRIGDGGGIERSRRLVQ